VDPAVAGWVALAALLILVLLGVPVAIALAGIGLIGYSVLAGWGPTLAIAGIGLYGNTAAYIFTVLPMFILMGNLAFYGGFARDFFDVAYKWTSKIHLGLAHATMLAYAVFSAASGSSIAACAAMTKIVAPEFERLGYDRRLAFGVITAGATLDPLIPPSVLMVLYGIIARVSIAKLLIAGILPGLVLMGTFMAVIVVLGRSNPHLGPDRAGIRHATLAERFRSLGSVWGILTIVVVSLGGIYAGVFTPTEGGAVGACAALLLGVISGRLRAEQLRRCLLDTATTTGSLFLIMAAAFVFGYLIAITQLAQSASAFVLAIEAPRAVILGGVAVFYLVIGCLIDMVAAMFITLPIILPGLLALGYDPVWFGVFMVQLCVIALLTPPYGLNLFTIKSVLPQADMGDIIRGSLPFTIASLVNLVILAVFPEIALVLPNMMD
jgi:tripartite ATP-independent transporter DctM subunit